MINMSMKGNILKIAEKKERQKKQRNQAPRSWMLPSYSTNYFLLDFPERQINFICLSSSFIVFFLLSLHYLHPKAFLM